MMARAKVILVLWPALHVHVMCQVDCLLFLLYLWCAAGAEGRHFVQMGMASMACTARGISRHLESIDKID